MHSGFEVAIGPEVDRNAIAGALRRGQAAIQSAAGGQLAPYSWDLVEDAVTGAVLDTIRAQWLGWFAHGWSAVREILDYAKEEKRRINKTAFVKLGRHKLKGTLPIVVTISCGGARIASVPFDVPITAELNAVTLSILKGHIVAFGGGECKITLCIKYGNADLSGELPLKTFKLPGKYQLKRPGIEISRMGQPSQRA